MKKTNIENSREERSGKERGREKKIYRADERMGEGKKQEQKSEKERREK